MESTRFGTTTTLPLCLVQGKKGFEYTITLLYFTCLFFYTLYCSLLLFTILLFHFRPTLLFVTILALSNVKFVR